MIFSEPLTIIFNWYNLALIDGGIIFPNNSVTALPLEDKGYPVDLCRIMHDRAAAGRLAQCLTGETPCNILRRLKGGENGADSRERLLPSI